MNQFFYFIPETSEYALKTIGFISNSFNKTLVQIH